MATFLPDKQTLEQLKSLLKDVHVGDNEDLGKASDHPDFTLYCCSLLSDHSDSDVPARYTAGICLKSVLSRGYTQLEDAKQTFLEENLFKCMASEHELIRRAGKLALIAIVSRKGILHSEKILEFFVKCINSNQIDLISDALDSLALIFQDINCNSENVEDPERIFTSNFIVELIGKLISLIGPDQPTKIRLPSFDCLTNLLVASPPELIARIEVLVGGLLKIIDDPEAQIRNRIFGFFLGLCQVRKDLFISHSNTIFPKLAKCMWDTDKSARRACFMVFWEFLAVHDDEESSQVIQLVIPHLGDIVPALVVNSVLTEEDKENLLGAISTFVETNKVYEKGLREIEDEDNFQFEDEEHEVLDSNGTYTLRKISLRCLIKIFEFMGGSAFSAVQGQLEEMFASKDVLKIEAAACILGSIGNCCLEQLKPGLGASLTILLNCAESNNQFLQATSIWAIGKFREHLLSENSPAAKEFLHKYLDIILTVIKGSSLVAQDSASGALKKLCKTESDLIVELYPKLLEVFKAILQENSYRRIFIYDTLAEFVETIQDETFMKQVLNEVMPILIESFGGAKINDGAFIPQFECINSLIRVSGDNIFPFAEKLLSQVVTIAREISSVLKVSSPKQKSKDRILLEYELNNNLMRCFDFIGTLAMSIPDKFTGLSCAAIIPQLIFAYLDTDNLLLKQLVYSVLGDLMPIMDSHVFEGDIDRAITALIDDTKILPASMDPGKTYLSIATNALYALNEVLLKFPQRVDPEKVLARLLKIYENSKVEWDDQLHKFLTLNCALVYGNLGHQNPAVAARHLKECLKKVCYGFILSKSDDDKTKNDAFIGLNRIILCNPADFLLNVAFYLEAIGLYQQPSPEVAQGITHILEELLKGDESVKKQLSEAYLGLSGPAKSGLKAQFNFPPN